MSSMSIAPMREYMTQGGEPISLAEAERILTEAQDVTKGIKIFCEAQLKDARSLTWEESASLAFINIGLEKVLAMLCRTVPDAPKHEEVES